MEKKKILVIEHEQDTSRHLTTLFEENGYDALAAEDGEAGVQIARGRRPDLITLDISIPGKSGLEALRGLQGDAATAAIPVIMLKEPIDTDDLLGQVRSLLA